MHAPGIRAASSWVAAALLLVALLGGAREAAATSCLPPEGFIFPPAAGDDGEAPIDVQPWLPPWYVIGPEPSECALESDDDVVPVELERTPLLDDRGDLFRFRPARDLLPLARYELLCPANGALSLFTFTTLGAEVVTAPPPTIREIQVRHEQGDEGCCGSGDFMTVRAELDDADDFVAQSGYIEVANQRGEVWVVVDYDFDGQGAFEARFIEAEGPFTFTPIAGDGERGEPVVVAAKDVRRALVYLACGVGGRGTPLGLLLALGWALRARRRRSR